MKDERILSQAIMKAMNHGFKSKGFVIAPELSDMYLHNKQVFNIIFDHDFAKAFWGEEEMPSLQISNGEVRQGNLKTCAYHLQQMVLEAYPLRYLEKFLED